MSLTSVSALDAARLVENGAMLIDVREPDEFARARIHGAQNHPLGRISRLDSTRPAIFICRSGARTRANAAHLATCHFGESYMLSGGLDGWRKAGLPVAENHTAPLEIMRQVQIAAGLLILAGLALGLAIDPAFLALTGFVGAGLTFAGLTGWCGMAHLLAKMPWNRSAAA
jgi:rhodanese-related sulfurtransferase